MNSSCFRPLIACLILGPGLPCAASAADSGEAQIEQEIRALENQEVEAVLAHDAATLERLWDQRFIVHNPEGRIVPAGARVLDRPVFQNARSSFVRRVETIAIRGDVVFSMGSEVVVPSGDAGKTGEAINRRYTNVWMRTGGSWKLVARHANRICEEK